MPQFSVDGAVLVDVVGRVVVAILAVADVVEEAEIKTTGSNGDQITTQSKNGRNEADSPVEDEIFQMQMWP